jgi:putative ABC transport system permease protein
VIIIDETLAARAWPGEPAVGRMLQVNPNGSPNAFAEVVGVVEHIRSQDLARAVRPQIYRPLVTFGGTQPSFVVRADVDPASLAPTIRELVASTHPGVPVDRLQPLSVYVDDALAHSRLTLALMAGFGLVALVLAAVGIYGVIANSVVQRTNEIGIRMALGAQVRDILSLVLGGGLRLTLIGTALGLAGAWLVARLLRLISVEFATTDPALTVSITAFLILVAMVACYLPARRAAQVDPISALRAE